MNRQPYATPPRWWSPRLSSRWIRFWSPFRRRRADREHGLTSIEIEGVHHLQRALHDGLGVLITPNHPTHADPFVLTEVSARLGLPFYYMTAWQVFERTHALGRRVLRHHGCFSINREGHDLPAYRQAVSVLEGRNPLVIFPEGEVFHLNDRVMPFRRGAATAALRAARRSGRPVACIPCRLRFRYVDDPRPQLAEALDRIERRAGLDPHSSASLPRRLGRLAERLLRLKEAEYFDDVCVGPFDERCQLFITLLLQRLEARYGVRNARRTVPERVKELRRLVIAERERAALSELDVEDELDDLFFVMQLCSYPSDYLAGDPSIERLAETVDKLEEDVLQVPTAGLRGARRAVVEFGEPILAQPHAGLQAAELTETLQRRVQHMLDRDVRSPSAVLRPEAPVASSAA